MVLTNFILSLFLITIYSYNVNCQLDLDINSLDTNLTYVYINSSSALRLFPSSSLSLLNYVEDTVTVTISTDGGLTQRPCFTQSNTPPCRLDSVTSSLNEESAMSLLQDTYYENSDPIDGRQVVVTVIVMYQVSVGDRTFDTYTQAANVFEKRDKPVISFKDGYEYAPVYDHNFRPVPFLNGDNFTLLSLGEVYTSLLVCVFTQSELESIFVDTDHPLVDSPVSINEIERVCSRVSFSSIDNTTLLQVLSAFTYSETTEIIDNFNDRVISISVDAGTNIGDTLYFNMTYHITLIPTPIFIRTLPVVYYEDVGREVYIPDLSSVKLSDVINISRQSLTDLKPITSLLFQSNSTHIPKVNIWNDQMCSSSWLTHPVHKFEFCTDEQFFFNVELTSGFQLKFNPSSETIIVDGRNLDIYSATTSASYGYHTLIGSATQDPEFNHFSIWFKNAPGELTGCPLEVVNNPQVNYQICLSGSDSTIEFWYSGLTPEHHEVRVTYPTEGAFRLDDWNYVSVSVTANSIHLLLNELELTPNEFYWIDSNNMENFTQIPIHLYSTSKSSITNIYILGKRHGFIGEVTGVIVDQFFISTREAYCMFSCIEGFYMNETIIKGLTEKGLQIDFVRESFEVVGNMSVSDVTYILQNLYYNTPMNSTNIYRSIATTVSDDLFVSTEVTRISYGCTPGSCSNNSYCYVTESADICLCKEGYLDASTEENMSVCKHPMDCSYMNGGCSELETCLQIGEEVRECEDVCDSSPCLNGGICNITNVTKYECDCIGEFYGSDCECRNNCLAQDCSPGSCVDYCNGSFVCVYPTSSSTPIPTSSLLSTVSQVMTSSLYSSQVSSQPTSSPLQSSSSVSSSLLVSSSFVQESSTPVSSDAMTSSFSSSSQLSSSLLVTSSSIPSSSLQVSSSYILESSTPVSSSVPIYSSVLPESSTVVFSDAMTSSFSSSSQPTSSLLATSSSIPSSSLQVSSSYIQESSTPVSSTPISSSVLPESSTAVFSDTMTSSYFSTQVSSLLQTLSFATSSTPISSSVLPESSTGVSSDIMTSSLVPSSLPVSSSVVGSSTIVEFMTSSLIPSSSVRDIVTSPSILPTSSLVESSTVTEVVTSSQIPTSSAFSQSLSSSSSLITFLTSSQIPSSSVVDTTASSEVPSSSVFSSSSVLIASSQLPSSSSDVIASSQLPSSSSDVIASSQLPSSSSDVIASSQLPSSSRYVIASSQLPSSTSDVIASSQLPSSTRYVIASSQLPSSTSDVIASSQLPSSTSDVIASSQLPSSSSDVIASSQLPSSSRYVIASSQLPSSSSDVIASSQLPSSSSDVIATSQLPSSSSDVIASSQLPSSTSDVIASSQLPSSSSDVTASSQLPSSSSDVTASSQLPSSSSDVFMSSRVPSSSLSSSQILSSSADVMTSSLTQPVVSTSVTSSSIMKPPSNIPTSSKSIDIFDTSSTTVPTAPPTIPGITETSNVEIAIGIGMGIFILILVVILTIALIISLFLYRMGRHQDLDPTKEFDQPHSNCPAEITAVFKNKETTVIN